MVPLLVVYANGAYKITIAANRKEYSIWRQQVFSLAEWSDAV